MNTLLICGLQVTLVALVGCLTSLALRHWLRTSAALSIGATLGAVVLLTACAFSSWPSWLRRPAESEPAATGGILGPASSMLSDPYVAEYTEVMVSTPLGSIDLPRWTWPVLFGTSITPPAPADSEREAASSRWTWQHWLGAILFLGTTCGLLRVIGGLYALRNFVHTSRPLQTPELLDQLDLLRAEMGCTPPVELRECLHLATAATVGWRRPVILLSETWRTWSEVQLRSVMAHEIAHITRGDFLAGVAAQLGVVLHFYHPLVHWLANRLRLEQELAADALAAHVVGGSRAYLNAIGELALKHTNEPVGWPAHTFLPTRRTFLRRIEMLRDLKLLSGQAPLALRWGTLAAIAAVTLVAIGLRPPGGEAISPSLVQAEDIPLAQPQKAEAVELPQPSNPPSTETPYVLADAYCVIAARPDRVIAHLEKTGAFPKVPEDQVRLLTALRNCEKAVVVLAKTIPRQIKGRRKGQRPNAYANLGVVLTFAKQEFRDTAMQELGRGEWAKSVVGEIPIETSWAYGARFTPNETTLVFGDEQLVQRMALLGPKSESPLTQSEEWNAANQDSVSLAWDTSQLKNSVVPVFSESPLGKILQSPFWNSALRHTVQMTFGDRTEFKVTTLAAHPTDVVAIEAAIREGIAADQKSPNFMSYHWPCDTQAMDEVERKLFDGYQIVTDETQLTLISSGDATPMLVPIVEVLGYTRSVELGPASAPPVETNLRPFLLALISYHKDHGHFPPAFIVDPKTGMSRSWRVEILPYIGEVALYEQYRKDEPWDSAHNKTILAQMPAIFRHPSESANTTNTSILAAYGPGMVFDTNQKEGTKLSDITDGIEYTIALIERTSDIPWTKPEETLTDLSANKPSLFNRDGSGVFIGFLDTSIDFNAQTFDSERLKALFTRAGGEVIPMY